MLKSDKEFFCVAQMQDSKWFAMRAWFIQQNLNRKDVMPYWVVDYEFESPSCSSKSEAILWFVAAHPEEQLFEIVGDEEPLSDYSVSKENLQKMFKEVEI